MTTRRRSIAAVVACAVVLGAFLTPSVGAAQVTTAVSAYQTRQHVSTHINALRKYVWKAVTDSTEVPKADYAIIRARAEYLLVQLKKQVTALSAAKGAAEVDAVGRKVDALQVLGDRFVAAAAAVRTALSDMNAAATKGQTTLAGAIAGGTTSTAGYRSKQAGWAGAGTWAAYDRTAALAAIPKGLAAPARTYAAQAARATKGLAVTPASGLTGIPGGCALPTVTTPATWLGAAVNSGLHMWTGAADVSAYRTRIESLPEGDPLLTAHNQMLWRINHGDLTQASPANANEAMDVTGKLGYQALVDPSPTKRSDAKAALVRIARELLTPGPTVPGLFDGTFYMWTAASALNWAEPTGIVNSDLAEMLWVRWQGPYSCMLARGDSMVRGADNITVVTTSAIALAALADASSRPSIAAALVKSAVAADLPGMRLLAADGGTPEGPAYWNLQSVPVAGLMSTWKQIFPSGGPVTMPSMSKTATFAYQLPESTLGIVPTYSDSKKQEKPLRSTLPAWVASQTSSPEGFALAQDAAVSIGIQLLWWPQTDPGVPVQSSRLFPTSGIAVLRSTSATAWVTGGVPVGVHTHLQAGGVSLIANGVQWGVDPGAGDYTQAGYFDVNPDSKRWTYFHPGVIAHSTLHTAVLSTNPGQVVGGVTPMTLNAGSNSVNLNMKPALKGVGAATRSVVLDTSGRLTITDAITAGPAMTWEWVTGASAQRVGSTFVLTRNGQSVNVTFSGLPSGSALSIAAAGVNDDFGSPLQVLKVTLPAGSYTLAATIG